MDIKGAVDLRERVYGAVKTRDWTLLEMVQEKQSLENIFRELTMEGSK